MGKRYYWLKLPDDFFRQKPIKKLRRIAGGDTYTIIYLKMLLISLKNEGKLFFDGVEENFTEEIALELDEEEENVKVTVQFLMAQGLLQLIDESEYELTECSRMVGSESASAERMRRLRDKKVSQCDIGVTQQLHLSDVEKEKEIEKDKEMLYNADGVPFAQVSSFQSKTSFNNTKYQPLGQNRELETNNTIGVTITISEIVVLDGELFNNVVSAVNKGESPVMTLDGVIEGRNGSQERITYRECIFSGDQDLQNVSTGDTLSRSYNLHCNGEVEPRSSLTI